MKFEHPGVLFAFLLLAIPIIIHLFNFRRYKNLYFSSLLFLKQIDEQTKSTQKLKHLLVLLMRVLAFSALILAFSQPYIPAEKNNSPTGAPVLAIYIDNSFSMSLKGTEGELLSEAREQARKMIQKADDETRILLATNEMSGIEQRLYTKNDALNRLDKITFSSQVRPAGEVITWMRESIAEENRSHDKIGTIQYIILSDFQKVSGSFSRLTEDKDNYYYPIQLVAQEQSNLSVDSIWFNDPNFKTGINNELNIKITNHGKQDLSNIELQLDINGTKRDVFVDIHAEQSIITPVNYSDYKPGIKRGLIKLNDKQLFFDDEYYFTYEVKAHTSVLIIDGKYAVSNISKVYNLDSYYQVQSVSETAFNNDFLKEKDLVVINGIQAISSGMESVLTSFVKEGGTLLVFPGEDADLNSYNIFLNKLKMPSLGSSQTEGLKVKNLQYNDLFFKGVFEKKPEQLNLPLQTKVYKTANTTQSNSVQLITLQNGMPLFVRSNSSQNIFLFCSSLTPAYGNFVSNALFSTIVLRSGELSQRRIPISLVIGQDGKFPVYKITASEKPLHLQNEEIDYIPVTERINQVQYISIAGPASKNLKAGLYTITGEQPLGTIALNYDRTESDIRTLTPDEIKNGLAEKGIQHVTFSSIKEGQSLSNIQLNRPTEYWRIFLVLALVFLLTEMLVIRILK